MERAAAGPKEASFSVTSTHEYGQSERASEDEKVLVRTKATNEHADDWTQDVVPYTSTVHAQPESQSLGESDLHQQAHR